MRQSIELACHAHIIAYNLGMTSFDPALLLREYGDEALVRDLAQLLVTTVPSQVENVRTAVAANDSTAVRAAAHKLRGTLASFGLTGAVEAARQLEAMAAGGDLSQADALGEKLVADALSLCESARAWLASGPSLS
jgi:HPt (histidine-containing phosphotransfer) domain-containing protein